MPEQYENEDDRDVLGREIAGEVASAFAAVVYPGDEKLVRYPNYYENADIIEAFRGKHWRDISPDILFRHRDQTGLFSPEAFCFYLPCFLIAALIHSHETDTLWEMLFFTLTPPANDGDDMDWLVKMASLLDTRQKAAVVRYIKLWLQTESGFLGSGRERTLPFWQRISPSESDEGSLARRVD